MENWAYLGAGWIHQILVSLDTLALFKAITVDDLGLCITRDDEDDIPCGAVLQGADLVAAKTRHSSRSAHNSYSRSI